MTSLSVYSFQGNLILMTLDTNSEYNSQKEFDSRKQYHNFHTWNEDDEIDYKQFWTNRIYDNFHRVHHWGNFIYDK